MNIVIHLKTGNKYTLHGIVIDATNDAPPGRRMALYSNSDQVFFVMEISEFMEKFKAEE